MVRGVLVRTGRSMVAAVLAAGVFVGPVSASPVGFAAAAATAGAPPLPPAPACATTTTPITSGGHPKPASPLPVTTSEVGGVSLGLPGLHVLLPAGVRPPPAIRATAWIVTDLITGQVLAACNAHVGLAPASTLKVLTALALHRRISSAALYTATAQDASIDGTKVGLVAGSRYPVDALWHGLLMSSGNDCANALANLAGGDALAGAAMTATARSLGALDTHVANTSGLDAPGQVSSAYDLALFGRAALGDPPLRALMEQRSYVFPGSNAPVVKGDPSAVAAALRKPFQIQNHNWLLFNYPGATGVKNGYTTSAGGSYIGSATRGSRSYLVTILQADTGVSHLARDLLNWAFAFGPATGSVGMLVNGPVAAPAESVPSAAEPVPAPAESITAPSPADHSAAAGGRLSSRLAIEPTPTGTPPSVWLVLGFMATLALAVVVAGLSIARARRRP